ncbi:MAG TPA: 3-oxoadipate enol-lactonase [Solirubrobacterales bacterium]|nr:3-oxoadipate enol-lactonase [Solirubrobacterales bacterium]
MSAAPGAGLPHHRLDGPEGAPAIVLGNALGTDLTTWDAVAARLEPTHRVLRYDHRGQGRSGALPGPESIEQLGRDVLALLDANGIEHAAYCGISLGGMVGLWLAAEAPARIDSLVALCSSAHPGGEEAWRRRAAIVTKAGSTRPIAEGVVARWPTAEAAAADPELVARLEEMLRATPPVGYSACCMVLASLDLREALRRIAVPTLVVGADQDEALPPAHSREIAAGIAASRLEIMEPAAHLPIIERPDAVAALILGHLGAAS